MKSGIYKITNSVNGKFYIGSSKDIEYRWNEHKQYLNGNYHGNPKLQHSWNFYGSEKFLFEIIEETSSDKKILLKREQYYLDLFKPYMRDIGYNICPKAAGGDNITHNPNRDEFIEKMSGISAGENNPMFGRNHSDESKLLQKEKAKGRFTLEWFINKCGQEEGHKKYNERVEKLKNRNINYSFPNLNSGKKMKPMSDDSKQKIKKVKHEMKTNRPFLLSDIKSNNFTIKQLSEKYNTSNSMIKYYKRQIKKESNDTKSK